MKYLDALNLFSQLSRMMRPLCFRLDVAGSVRRQVDQVKDLEIVCAPRFAKERDYTEGLFDNGVERDVSQLYKWAKEQDFIQWIKPGTSYIEPWEPRPEAKYMRGLIKRGVLGAPEPIKLDLFICRPENWGVIHLIRTGSAEFSERFVTYVKAHTEYRVSGGNLLKVPKGATEEMVVKSGSLVPCLEERQLFDYAGLAYVVPRLRRTASDVRKMKG